ncbi:hypothetical protein JCM14076_16280 [Methylosoma difficile]
MDKQSLLNDVVKLYRLCGKPNFMDGTAVNCEILLNEEVTLLINAIYCQNEDVLGSIKCDGDYIDLPIQELKTGQDLTFRLNIPLIEHKLFFKDIADLITNYTGIKIGKLPESFYLIGEDYLTTEANEPEKLIQLRRVCRWILFLDKALPHTDKSNNSFTFVLLTEDKENKGFKKHLIESRFTFADLKPLDGLESFEEMLKNQDLHCSERLAVVRNALEELLSKRPATNQQLGYILSEFEVFKKLYQDNYETYINGFSLKDFKKEVIEKHQDVASKIDGALYDVINKALAIPVSIVTIGALIKEDQLINSLVVSCAVLLVPVLMWWLIGQHLKRLEEIQLDIKEIFDKFENKKESAAQFVDEKRQSLVDRSKSITVVLKILKWLGFAPVIAAIFLLLNKFPAIPIFFCDIYYFIVYFVFCG